MIRRNASLVLAIAIIALGTAQASAELIHIDPSSSTFNNGDAIEWVAAPSGSTLPAVQLFVSAQTGTTVTFSGTPNVLINRVGGESYLAGKKVVTSPASPVVESWQGGWMTGTSPNNAGYELVARFREYGTTTYVPMPYVEVEFEANDSNDKGWIRAYSSAGTLLQELIVDLPGDGAIVTGSLTAGTTPFSYITATAYGSGQNVLIREIAYGTGPDPVEMVPEPASIVSLVLGCFGLALIRKRLV